MSCKAQNLAFQGTFKISKTRRVSSRSGQFQEVGRLSPLKFRPLTYRVSDMLLFWIWSKSQNL